MIHHADVIEALRAMPDNSFHGCLTDPPYGLSFMGHGWDHGVPSAEVWREVLRVLRPGAYLLAFGGTRTFHRLTCAIEDAGFEVRDCLMWLYGSGFPKSHDVSKAIDREAGAVREVVGRDAAKYAKRNQRRAVGDGDALGGGFNYEDNGSTITAPATEAARQWSGYGTALKPAWEPILVARKPIEGTVAANVQRWGCGGLAIHACRVGEQVYTQEEWSQKGASRTTGATYGTHKPSNNPVPLGRWPANVILDEEAGAALDAQSGTKMRPGERPGRGAGMGYHGANGWTGKVREVLDAGGASRFFYCAKASRKERGEGNIHPTVKPLALARYLARLILPPVEGSRLLVPFCGSGSEMVGALQAGWSHVEGIDSWDVAVSIARARLAHHEATP